MALEAQALHPELAGLVAQMAEAARRTEALIEDLTPGQLTWRPAPGEWSIADCLAHLNVVNGIEIPLLETAIADAWRRGLTGAGPYRYGRLSRFFVSNVEPPPKRRFRAPKSYRPVPAPDPAAARRAYRANCERIQELMRQASGLDLARVKIVVPFFRLMKMPLGARFAVIAAHNRRHLWQAERVRHHPSFPAA